MKDIETFRKIKSDKDKWKWLIHNQGKGLVVNLDNDDTFVVDANDEDADVVSFSSYIGWADGVSDLLDAIGVKYELV